MVLAGVVSTVEVVSTVAVVSTVEVEVSMVEVSTAEEGAFKLCLNHECNIYVIV